jgi:hypothetical protein
MRRTAAEVLWHAGHFALPSSPRYAQTKAAVVFDRRFREFRKSLRTATATASFVFDRATVWLCLWRRDGLARERLIQSNLHVISRAWNVGWIRTCFAVDCAFIGDFSFRINDDHVGRVLGAVRAPRFAFRIEKQRRLPRLPRFSDLLRLFRRDIAFRAGRIGIDGQPDHSFARILILQFLHVAAAVMLLHERAFRVKPFEHDIFALVLRKRVGAALRVRERKIRRSAAHRRRIESVDCSSN